MRTLLLAAIAATLLSACIHERQSAAPWGVRQVASPLMVPGMPVTISRIDRLEASSYFSAPDRVRHLEIIPGGHKQDLEVGRKVPRGIHVDRMPDGLAERLQPLPDGYRWALADNTLIILDRERNVVDVDTFYPGIQP